MSATDELRRLLDERNVEYKDRDMFGQHVFHWGEPLHGAMFTASLSGEWTELVVENPTPQQAVDATLGPQITGETSDGYHTFNELYHHRAVLFSVIVRDHPDIAWKARKHHDGSMYDGMFIVGVNTPQGQATYHYDLDPYWSMFECRELERAPEWDGHTPDDAIARIATLGRGECRCVMDSIDPFNTWVCDHCGHPLDASDNFCGGCGWRVKR